METTPDMIRRAARGLEKARQDLQRIAREERAVYSGAGMPTIGGTVPTHAEAARLLRWWPGVMTQLAGVVGVPLKQLQDIRDDKSLRPLTPRQRRALWHHVVAHVDAVPSPSAPRVRLLQAVGAASPG